LRTTDLYEQLGFVHFVSDNAVHGRLQ